jgi:hypothetical protein
VASSDGIAVVSVTALLRKRPLLGLSDGVAVTSGVTILRTRAIVGNANGRATASVIPTNTALVLWNGSTFTRAGNYPMVLWDQAEFELVVEEGEENVDYVAYRDSTVQFNPVNMP